METFCKAFYTPINLRKCQTPPTTFAYISLLYVLYSKKLTELPNISDDIFLFLLLTQKNVQNVYQTTPTTFAFLSYSTFSIKQSSKSWPYSYRYITSINQDRKREGEASAFSLRIEPTTLSHCPRYNMKCSGEKVILRRIVHVVSEFPPTFHFLSWRFGLLF